MIQEAVRTQQRPVSETALPFTPKEVELLISTGRVMVLPGAGRSKYLYLFLLNDDFETFARLRMLKSEWRAIVRGVLAEDGRDRIDGGKVVLHGDFPVTKGG